MTGKRKVPITRMKRLTAAPCQYAYGIADPNPCNISTRLAVLHAYDISNIPELLAPIITLTPPKVPSPHYLLTESLEER